MSADIACLIEPLIPRDGGHELVRIGGDGDGAYLLPDDLAGIEACFSPGVNNVKHFEDHLAAACGIKSFMCDFTSDVARLQTPLIPGRQFFAKKWLDTDAGADSIDINAWIQGNTQPGSDLLLQMDIEGAEYRNLLHASVQTLSRFRVIALELHDLGSLGDSAFREGLFVPTLRKLAALFTCVHAHPNNCCGISRFGSELPVPNVLEVTFLRNDRLRRRGKRLTLPHPLDVINVPGKPPLALEGPWLAHADPIACETAALRERVASLTRRLEESSARVAALTCEVDAYTPQLTHYLNKQLKSATNIARGKRATQSSLSAFSTAEGAAGGINGEKTGRFGFHTALEPNPWWSVDLGAPYEISEILIFNRVDTCAERSRTLEASVSLNGTAWTTVYRHAGRLPFGGVTWLDGRPPLLITLENCRARYVKLECTEATCFHLDEIEIYGVPSKSQRSAP
jgi:hypothetical protein